MNTQLAIEYIDISKLKHDPHNARLHPASQIEELKSIIREVGFIDPVIIDKSNVIQCGNGAVKAARELGLKLIPCVRISNLSESQLRAFRIAHNRLAEKSEWDHVILKQEFNLLPVDLQPLTGFNPQEFITPLSVPQSSGNDWLDEDDDQSPNPPSEPEKPEPKGIRYPILVELPKADVQRARKIRNDLGFTEWNSFFLHLLNNLETEHES